MKRKKLSKLVALASALTLALSVGMVASATGSPGDEILIEKDGKTLVAQQGVGEGDAAKEAAKILSDPAKIKELLENDEDCKHVPEAVKVLNVQNIELLDENNQPIKDNEVFRKVFPNGVDITVDADGAKVGDVIYVIHWLKEGGYEVLPATVVAAGDAVVVHLDSLSPIAVIKVMKADGSAPELKVVDTKAKSPKTGK